MSTTTKKRPYSLAYQSNPGTTPRRYLLSGLPPGLWIKFIARAIVTDLAIQEGYNHC
jgi:hypothetical protein